MDIDERLQALVQSLELLTHDVEGMRAFINDVAHGTARLLQIAEMHQQRLDSHENRLDNLEGQ